VAQTTSVAQGGWPLIPLVMLRITAALAAHGTRLERSAVVAAAAAQQGPMVMVATVAM